MQLCTSLKTSPHNHRNIKMRNPSFTALPLRSGTLYDYSHSRYPTVIHGASGRNFFHFDDGSTYYVFVQVGEAIIDGTWPLTTGMFGSFTRGKMQVGSNSKVLIIERVGFIGLFGIGGPIEEVGRLKYIDGCTDSLLVPPVKKGDACLNHLHFPPKINQTMHTHPSIRVGIVASGFGECVTPFGNTPLQPGMAFIIHEENGEKATGLDGKLYDIGSHCFRTFDGTMDVVAWHPDSDFGPEDENHPMINRTIVDGVSAKYKEDILTK